MNSDEFMAFVEKLMKGEAMEGRMEKMASVELLLQLQQEEYEKKRQVNPFEVGEIVTVRDGGAYRWRGVPHSVVEVFKGRLERMDELGEPLKWVDMIVGVVVAGEYREYIVASSEFEVYSEH